MIFILAAPIRSGKTTSLIKWSAGRNDVHGILTPLVDGKRVFMNVWTKEQWPMEATGDEEKLLVGRFQFSKAGFEKAIDIIKNAIDENGWLIIDEIGPLELRGEGFHDVLKEILGKRKENILLVVREGLAKQVKDHFAFDPVIIAEAGSIS